jgi:excisionase family DNA binding protein
MLPSEVTMNSQKTLSPREAANRLGISLNAVYSLLWAGKISAEQRENRWHIPKADVDRRLVGKRPARPSVDATEKQVG